MALPSNVLQLAESHACFTGFYGPGSSSFLVVDPSLPPEWAFDAQCMDCLMFRVGALATLLPHGMTCSQLATELSEHMRQVRGYDLAFSGYHVAAGGFWLSAAYYGSCGLFLLDASRTSTGNEVELLVEAFRSGVAPVLHPAMIDKRQYASQIAYLDLTTPLGPVTSLQSLLNSPRAAPSPRQRFRRIVLAEFLPVAQSAQPVQLSFGPPAPTPTAPTAQAPAAAPLVDPGAVCGRCGEAVRERPLFNTTYVGCRCG